MVSVNPRFTYFRNMRRGVPNLFKAGTQTLTGLDEAVLRNIEACRKLSDITRTSLGPNGMNKLIINHLDKIFVTNDAATIIREMEVEHPAAKMVTMASAMQEVEMGDCSNFVIIFAGELLAKAADLILMGLHPSEIVAGYNATSKRMLELLESLVVADLRDISSKAALEKCVKTSIASKQFGYEDFLSGIVADACLAVMPANPLNFVVDSVRVVKILGGDIYQTKVVKGLVVQHDSVGAVKAMQNANIAVFQCSLGPAETDTKGTVLIHNASELMNYNLSEEKEIERAMKEIADSGVNVIVTGGAVDDMAKHFIDKFGMMVLKTSSKFELRRFCKSTGAQPLVSLGPVSREMQGHCASVVVQEVGGSKVCVFTQATDDPSPITTILLRSSTNNHLNDLERALDDGVNAVKAMVRDGRMLAGAGAVDIELARQLKDLGSKTSGLEQYAIKKFAEALEVVPRTLAENAGLQAANVIADLYAAHAAGQASAGVNIVDGGVADAAAKGIFDSLAMKKQAVKLAVDAALTILRVDQIIHAKPAGGPRFGKSQASGNWDEDD